LKGKIPEALSVQKAALACTASYLMEFLTFMADCSASDETDSCSVPSVFSFLGNITEVAVMSDIPPTDLKGTLESLLSWVLCLRHEMVWPTSETKLSIMRTIGQKMFALARNL
jgi:hypothetical protein